MPKPNVREELLTAGLSTLHQRGFNATSVQDITEAAGVPKGSFYNHFDSKEVLGAEVVLKYRQAAEARLAALRDPRLEPLVRLRKYFEGLVRTLVEANFSCGCLLGNFGMELSAQSPLIREQVATGLAVWCDEVALVIGEAQRAGTVPKEFGAKTLAKFIVNAWQGAVLRAKVDQDRVPLDLFVKLTFSKILA